MSWFSPSRGAMRLLAVLFALAFLLSPLEGAAQLVLPVIISHPQSQTVALGSDVTFSITVTNTASLPLTNFLRRAGVSIATNIANERFASFTLRNVQTNAARTYTIGVLNALAGRQSSNATLTIVTQVVTAGYSFASESCLPANGALDPGETVTLHFALSATNGYAATNLVATLEETNGVVAPSGPQTYGVLAADGTPVLRPFTFTANGTCGGQVHATLRLFDGSNDWGRVTFVLPLGITTANGPECCTANLADLAVSISDQPEVVALASNLTWTITVTNRGPETAHNVVVTNRLAPELMYLSAQAGAGACAVQQDTLMCQLGELPANTSWPITITTLVNAMGTGSITNRVGVTSAQADPNWTDNKRATHATKLIQPTLRINNTTVDEGETGMSYAIFDVRLSFPIQRVVTLQYATADDTATAGDDYLPQSGTITFPPGVTEQQLIVTAIADAEPEPAEVFHVNLLNSVQAEIMSRFAFCVILPDQQPTAKPNTVQQVWSTVTTNLTPVAFAVDAIGNAWMAGSLQTGLNGANGTWFFDYGVVKYNESGTMLWLASYGKTGSPINEQPAALAVDSFGNAYVTGNAGTVKFDPDGNQIWVNTNLVGVACAVDLNGNLCVTGMRSLIGDGEIVTTKLAPDGTTLWDRRYKTLVGAGNVPVAFAVDRDGSIYVAAHNPTNSMHVPGTEYGYHYVLFKYDSKGNLVWSDRWITNKSYILNMVLDRRGDICVTGDFKTSKLRGTDGKHLWTAWNSLAGGEDDNQCRIAVDYANNIYVSGFDGIRTATVIKYDPDGNELWVAPFRFDRAFLIGDIAIDPAGNAYVTGQLFRNGVEVDAVWVLDSDGNRLWVSYAEGTNGITGYGFLTWYPRWNPPPYIALDALGRVRMAGCRMVNSQSRSGGLVSLLPSVGIGQPQIHGPLIFETNSAGLGNLRVQASGDSPLHIQWYQSGRPIISETNATVGGGWGFSVSVSNTFGEVWSPEIRSEDAVILGQMYSRSVALGESLTLFNPYVYGSVWTLTGEVDPVRWTSFGRN